MNVPDGWTDDMSVPLPHGKTEEDLVERVIAAVLAGAAPESIETDLRREFGLDDDDAAVARDRVLGGIYRAGTKDPRNRPDARKDPIASTSYRRAKESPELIGAVFPERFGPDYASKSNAERRPKPWWRFW